MKKIYAACCLLALLLCATPRNEARSDDTEGMLTPPSMKFEVGMVFYKMIGAKPDFNSWLTSDPVYKRADPARQAEILATELPKLRSAFNVMDASQNPLIVRTAVKTRIVNPPGSLKPSLEVKFPADGDIYFPYTLGDQTITLIPNGIDLYRRIPMTQLEAESVQGRIAYNNAATLLLEIVPVKADGSQPMQLDGRPQWLMIGEIGFIGLYNNTLQPIWSFQAPWYIRRDQQSLFSLHKVAQTP